MFIILNACASTNIVSKFSSGELKNSLPLFDKDHIEITHSVLIPQFFNDNDNWTPLAQEILSSINITVISTEKTANTLKTTGKNPQILPPEKRADHLTALARSLQADAVLNGLIINKDDNSELVLQLLSSKDSRVIWWQSVDFNIKQDSVVQTEQKALLVKMLSPVLQHIGKKKKPVLLPAREKPIITEQPDLPKPETQPKTDFKPKPLKQREKDLESPEPDDDFSPM